MFSQNNAGRHFLGCRGFAQGGLLGHAKTPEEDGMATFTYDGVIGSEQSLEVKDFFARFAGILTGSSSLLRNLWLYSLFVQNCCTGSLILWGLPRTSCPKQ